MREMEHEQKETEKVYDSMTHPSSWAEGEELKYKYVVISSLVDR